MRVTLEVPGSTQRATVIGAVRLRFPANTVNSPLRELLLCFLPGKSVDFATITQVAILSMVSKTVCAVQEQ